MNEWISVNDRLPQKGQHCLYHAPIFDQKHEHSNIWFGVHDGNGNFSSSSGFFGGQEVTHWTPVQPAPVPD